MNAYQRADEITLVRSGPDYFERLEALLDNARERIHLQVYIFAEDETGRQVAAALKRAAQRGVQVWLLVDQFGSRSLLSRAFIKDLSASGVHFRFFSHRISFWKWHFGRTLHHKIAVADGVQALVGGINIANKYRGTPNTTAWLDFAVFIRGDVCVYLESLCNSVYRFRYFRKKDLPKEGNWQIPDQHEGLLRFRQNDWMFRRNEIYRGYGQALSSAKESLILTASYFLPQRTFRRGLANMVRRGKTVEILMSGPSDVPLIPSAEQYVQHWLLARGIRVFQWEHSVMHGKSFLTDGRWASVGSYNINQLSRFRSLELNVEILDPGFLRQYKELLSALLTTQCVEITLDSVSFKNWYKRIKAWLAYYFVYYGMQIFFVNKRLK